MFQWRENFSSKKTDAVALGFSVVKLSLDSVLAKVKNESVFVFELVVFSFSSSQVFKVN